MVAMVEEEHHTESIQASFPHLPQTARELFDALPPLPGLRVEVVEGNLLVSPMGSPEHTWMAVDLHDALSPVRRERGWRGAPGGLNICIEGPRDSLVPDYVLAPPDCPRWGAGELLSSGVVMVAEVVSPGSVHTDREEKVRLYAVGQVPIYLSIDPISKPPAVTVFSDIKDDTYRTIFKVDMGTPIKLPAPVDFELDTSIFKV
ncbi:Uma2 family endonuclease [Nonomuraea sp. NBC_00507]|uniref:Uma2 family endonuclease n=1 Tax=Nonomuraea sp. NBC_00507 TaxID=2976002 RepID=UPI002E1999B5